MKKRVCAGRPARMKKHRRSCRSKEMPGGKPSVCVQAAGRGTAVAQAANALQMHRKRGARQPCTPANTARPCQPKNRVGLAMLDGGMAWMRMSLVECWNCERPHTHTHVPGDSSCVCNPGAAAPAFLQVAAVFCAELLFETHIFSLATGLGTCSNQQQKVQAQKIY